MLKNYFKEKPEPETEPEIPERIQGTVYFIHKDGYGFIESESIKHERIYFHWKALSNARIADLKKGDKVEFTPRKYPDKKNWNALRVEVLV